MEEGEREGNLDETYIRRVKSNMATLFCFQQNMTSSCVNKPHKMDSVLRMSSSTLVVGFVALLPLNSCYPFKITQHFPPPRPVNNIYERENKMASTFPFFNERLNIRVLILSLSGRGKVLKAYRDVATFVCAQVFLSPPHPFVVVPPPRGFRLSSSPVFLFVL